MTVDDIDRATYIYGPAVPLLKGKMTRAHPRSPNILYTPIPSQILQQHPTLQLYIDFFYVNRMPILHTKSSAVNFVTVQTGHTRSLKSIIKGLDVVLNIYRKRGFQITNIHADNEFDLPQLHNHLRPSTLAIYGRDEHVGVIERSTRTIKERCRSICHTIPYTKYTKIMTYALVEHAVYWVNAFPTLHSIQLSPASIVTGRPKPNFNNPTISFGRYALIHAKTTNNMKGRSVPGIALRASNEWGGTISCPSSLESVYTPTIGQNYRLVTK